MRYVRFKCALFVIVSVIVCLCGEANPWQGRYLYEADYGKNMAGLGMVVEYALTVNKTGDSPAAVLVMQGYQTDETILCNVTYTNRDASFFFKSYDNGETKNKYGVEQYKPGELLFTLEHPNLKGSKGLITHWQGLDPKVIKKSGFKKISGQP